jgi:predicted oxidoreductase
MVIQSKCGIRFAGEPQPDSPQRYDFSYKHIIESVEGSLRRLHTNYLDGLLLHRPDPLVEPEEVARAFSELHASGEVRYFGVSNHTAPQIALLQNYVEQPLVINQVQLSLLHAYLIDEGILANQNQTTVSLASGLLDYCRLNGILIQAWGPVAGGQLMTPHADAPDNVKKAAAIIASLALNAETTKEAVTLSWLLFHPAGIQPIIGTSRPDRVIASCAAEDFQMDRETWYALFTAGRGRPLP